VLAACAVIELRCRPRLDAAGRPLAASVTTGGKAEVYGGSGSRLSPVSARKASMRAGRYWMLLSRFLMIAVSWSAAVAASLPRPVLHVRLGRPPARPATGPPGHRSAGTPPYQGLSTPAPPCPSAPAPPLLACRLGADPQPARHLHRADIVLIHMRGLKPHAPTPGPPSSGQATTIWAPHPSRRRPAERPDHVGAPHVIKQTDPAIQLP
jgi:hypothetical protein